MWLSGNPHTWVNFSSTDFSDWGASSSQSPTWRTKWLRLAFTYWPSWHNWIFDFRCAMLCGSLGHIGKQAVTLRRGPVSLWRFMEDAGVWVLEDRYDAFGVSSPEAPRGMDIRVLWVETGTGWWLETCSLPSWIWNRVPVVLQWFNSDSSMNGSYLDILTLLSPKTSPRSGRQLSDDALEVNLRKYEQRRSCGVVLATVHDNSLIE